MRLSEICNKKVILYGINRYQYNIEIFLRDETFDIVYYIDDEYQEGLLFQGKKVINSSEINKNELGEALIVVCNFETIEQTQKLQAKGFVYGKDFIILNDLLNCVDKKHVNNILVDKMLVIFGTGNVCSNFLKSNDNLEIELFLDNDKNKEGSMFFDKRIENPSYIMSLQKEHYFIIIASNFIKEISIQLQQMGLQYGKDYIAYNEYSQPPSKLLEKTLKDFPRYNFVCKRPFSHVNIGFDSNVYQCCSSYSIKFAAGNLSVGTFGEIWNSVYAKILRLSVINKTYSFCNQDACEFLDKSNEIEFDHHEIVNSEQSLVCQVPSTISIGFDTICNLACKSCRDTMQNTYKSYAPGYLQEIEKTHNNILDKVLPFISDLRVASFGEVFLSKYYRDIVFNKYNGDKIYISTNGLLLNKTTLNMLVDRYKHLTFSISIDAASSKTYKKLRGGDYAHLLENLKDLSITKQQAQIEISVWLNFVVQEENFREMPQFVKLVKDLDFDFVNFQVFLNWGTFKNDEFINKNVVDQNSIHHKEFCEILKNPVFKETYVCFAPNIKKILERE